MTPVEALELALKKEEDAIEFYRDLLKKHTVIREILTSLIDAELGHKKIIEKKIYELTR